jgi:tRNA-splicing ligase RtcB
MAKKAKSQLKPHMIPSPIAKTLAQGAGPAQDPPPSRSYGAGEKHSDKIIHAHDWKQHTHYHPDGYFEIKTEDVGDVPVRLFFTQRLLDEAEDALYGQIVNATRFPGVKLVAITPDAHFGYGVPVGSVILTDGTLAMGPVGYDIGCGMVSARSTLPIDAATPDRRLAFNKAVMRRVEMGAGGKSTTAMRSLSQKEFVELIHGGADYYISKYGAPFDRSRAERNRIPVDDDWDVPWGGKGRPERGIPQLGSLGGGNHFMELQGCEETGTLFTQVHSGSRGFGHGLATNYFQLAKDEKPNEIKHLDKGYFTPDSPNYRSSLNAVAAGGNFAIINRLILFQQVAAAFREVFKADLELIYEISHNLVQKEWHPDYGDVWVHRKGATRAFPAGYPALAGTIWQDTGHPVLIPGSNHDYSFVLRPLEGAVRSGFSVNHGAGRRMSRSEAKRELSQKEVNQRYAKAGIIVNSADDVPLDEADACYKSAQEVVDAVVKAGLAEVEYRLWPLSSLKGLS